MSDETSQPQPESPPQDGARVPQVPSQEFFLRVNDFIQMANRIEKRYDSHHAQLAMLHGFARYSAHHYQVTSAANDHADNREAFADYIGGAVKQLVLGHLEDIAGPAPAPAAAPDSEAASAAVAGDGNPANDAG